MEGQGSCRYIGDVFVQGEGRKDGPSFRWSARVELVVEWSPLSAVRLSIHTSGQSSCATVVIGQSATVRLPLSILDKGSFYLERQPLCGRCNSRKMVLPNESQPWCSRHVQIGQGCTCQGL
jgi:hypothetical protein